MKRTAITLLKSLIITFFPKWYNKRTCSIDGYWNDYFKYAEGGMHKQWDEIIWPIIKDFNFETVLELAPGSGRNTEKLIQVADVIHAVDLNDYALVQLRRRFQNYTGKCDLHFHKNDGSNLKMLEASSITAIYCWDAAVHFDKTVIRDYIKEFSRVLKVNGSGFIHHSNLGASAKKDIQENPHWRSNMSKELFQKYCESNGLQIISQIDLAWDGITDCISVFQKKIAGQR